MSITFKLHVRATCQVCGRHRDLVFTEPRETRTAALMTLNEEGWRAYFSRADRGGYVIRCPDHAHYNAITKTYGPRPTNLRKAS